MADFQRPHRFGGAGPWCAFIILLFGTLALGCGPVQYVSKVTRGAAAEVEAAKAVRADKHAPYFFTLAVEYLNKAREEAAHADWQAANRFGKKSQESARKAREIATGRHDSSSSYAADEAQDDDSKALEEDE